MEEILFLSILTRIRTNKRRTSFELAFVICTVSGQNTIGRELTLLALIQPASNKQNALNHNWLFELQPAVMLQN